MGYLEREEQIKEAKTILEYNRKRLYRLPKKYSSLAAALDSPVKQDLLDIIAYWLKRDCIAYGSHDMVYFLSTHNGTYAVRKKSTKDVTNKRISYLCALGLLQKVEQRILYGYNNGAQRRYLRKGSLSNINRKFLRYKTWNVRAINTFKVFKYSSDTLDECNRRAERLLAAKITPGNISYNQLAANGLEDIAMDVFKENRAGAVEKKEKEYKILTGCMDFLIAEHGYTTKQEIIDNCLLEDKEIKKLFRIFKINLSDKYIYKRPTEEQKEHFKLENDNWIITAKEKR